MLHALGRVVKEARVKAELRQIDIATAAGVSHSVISRLERGKSWPLEPDVVVRAYESECGLRRNELWQRAVSAL